MLPVAALLVDTFAVVVWAIAAPFLAVLLTARLCDSVIRDYYRPAVYVAFLVVGLIFAGAAFFPVDWGARVRALASAVVLIGFAHVAFGPERRTA